MHACGVHVCLSVCLSTMCMPGVHRGQMSASDPLALELWMVVNFHVGAEEPNPGPLQEQVLAFYPLNQFSSPKVHSCQ